MSAKQKKYLEFNKQVDSCGTPEGASLVAERLLGDKRKQIFTVHFMMLAEKMGRACDTWKKMLFYDKPLVMPTVSKRGYEAAKFKINNTSPPYPDHEVIDLIHAGLGLAGEAGELCNAIIQYIWSPSADGRIKIIDECGDVLWYMGIICRRFNVDFDQILEANQKKLSLRYKSGQFEQGASHNPDKAAELEGQKDTLAKSSTRRGSKSPKLPESEPAQVPQSATTPE